MQRVFKRTKRLFLIWSTAFMVASCNSNIEPSYTNSEDLLAHYKFDSNTDNKIIESISNTAYQVEYVFNKAGFKAKSLVPLVDGVVGKAISFDGCSTYIEGATVDTSSSFTLSFYVAPRAYERNDGQYTSILSNANGAGGIDISVNQYGIWKLTALTTKGKMVSILSEDEKRLPLYDWSHIALTYFKEGSLIKIYLNGNEVGSLPLKNGYLVDSTSPLLIGRSLTQTEYQGFKQNYFNGLLDEIKFYKGVLSKEKIQEIALLALNSSRSPGIVFSYETLADSRYVPQYHMRNPRAWANEHYGAFHYNGKYHSFSQHNPFRDVYQNGQRWGHLVSDDLVHWKSLVPALVTSDNHIDNSQCFSGSSILDKDGKPMIFYTGVTEGSNDFNIISYAKPKDLTDLNLEDWVKSNQKVLDKGSASTKFEFRDPFVYKENGNYYILMGANNTPINPNDGAVLAYKATNDSLTNWEYLGVCYSGSSETYSSILGATYELPNLFKLTNKSKTISKYMLMISPIQGTCYNSVTYWLGDFNLTTGEFTPEKEEPSRIDLGAHNVTLAASGFYDEKNQRNLLTTMMRFSPNTEDAKALDINDYQTLWKELYLSDSGELQIKPIDEYDSLKNSTFIEVNDGSLSVSATNSMLSTIHSDSYKFEVEIDPNGDNKVGVYVNQNSESGEQILLSYDYSSKQFNCDTSRSSLLGKNVPSGGGVVNINGNVKLTVYVDRSMVEGYLNNTNQISTIAWKKYKNSDGIKIYSSSSNAIIKSLKVYKLSSAYGYDIPAYWGE